MTSPLAIPDYLAPYQLGRWVHHGKLNEVLSKYAFGEFWVTSEDEEQELAAVRQVFDADWHSSRCDVLYALLCDGDHEAQCRLLLSLGFDPNKPDKHWYCQPYHVTTMKGRPLCARALAPCRPDFTDADDTYWKRPRTTDDVSI
jgi:hypothetical protein